MTSVDDRKKAWQELFLDARGNLTRPAEIVIEDLRWITGFDSRKVPIGTDDHTDPMRLAALFAKHDIFRTIQERLKDG